MLYAIKEVGIKYSGNRQGAMNFPGRVLCVGLSQSVINLVFRLDFMVFIMIARYPSAVTIRKLWGGKAIT